MRRHDLKAILKRVAPYTMVHETGVRFTLHRVIDAIERDIPGVMIECGVWRGGCTLAMLLAQREMFGHVVRPVHLLDSFKGLPPAQPNDGPGALKWQASTVDNCLAERADVEFTLQNHGFHPGEYFIWEGWFVDTLPRVVDALTEIAVLRLDGDWYESTTQCMEMLVPLVSSRGTVIVDDYYAWDGCTRATHDYLSMRNLSYQIRSLAQNYSGAYFEVRDAKS